MFTNVGALERQLARQQDAMLQWRQKEHAKKYQVRQEGRRISIKVKGRGGDDGDDEEGEGDESSLK